MLLGAIFLLPPYPRCSSPFLVILPGMIAIALPTPRRQSRTAVQVRSVVPQQGLGLIPVKVDETTGTPKINADGKPVLDYDLAIPNRLLHHFPTGILGLGITALLASFMSGMAGNVRVQHCLDV